METPGTEAGTTTKRSRGRGRRDNSGQEAVLDQTALSEALPKLEKLASALKDAAEDYSEAVKKAAEKSGYNAAVVRKLVKARVDDKVVEVKRIVDQMVDAFSLT